MGAYGTATLDFGAFPGKSHASIDVADAGVLGSGGSMVGVWPMALAGDSYHTSDEFAIEDIMVTAGDVVAGVGFTIHGFNSNQLNEPLEKKDSGDASVGGQGTFLWGTWLVGWAWV